MREIFDDQLRDAIDVSAGPDFDAVSRILNKRSRQLLHEVGGGAGNERALSLARIMFLNVIADGTDTARRFLLRLSVERDTSDEYSEFDQTQVFLWRTLVSGMFMQMAVEGTLDVDGRR